MNKVNWLKVGLMAVSSSLCVGLSVASVGLGQQSSGPTNVSQGIANFLRDNGRLDRRRGRVNGSRRGVRSYDFCVVNPGQNDILWNQQPLMVMVQGKEDDKPDGIAIRVAGASDIDWQAPIVPDKEGEFQSVYEGAPMQLGEQYEWLFYTSFADEQLYGTSEGEEPTAMSFQIMPDGAERDRITADLEQKEIALTAEGASEEEISMAKAVYFFENELTADAIQMLFALEEPSQEVLATRDQLASEICERNMPYRVLHRLEE